MKKTILINLTIALILFVSECYSQNNSYLILSSNDTVYVKKFDISYKYVKVKIDKKKRKYLANEVSVIYDAKNKIYYERITPKEVEYKDSFGDSFFAERLTEGTVQIYKYLTNRTHRRLEAPKADIKVDYTNGSDVGKKNISDPGGKPIDKLGTGTFTGRTYSSGTTRSFYSYYIGYQGLKQDLLGYNQISLGEDEFKLLHAYFKNNNSIQLELENLFFSKETEKEKSVIALVKKYNDWAEKQ